VKTTRERIDAFKESLVSYLGRDKYNETMKNFFLHSPEWSYLEDRMLSEFSDDYDEEDSMSLVHEELESDMMEEDDLVFDDEDDEDNEFEEEEQEGMHYNVPTIDLRGSGGNTLAIIATCITYARTLGWSQERVKNFSADMTKGDYEHALSVVRENFPEIEIRD